MRLAHSIGPPGMSLPPESATKKKVAVTILASVVLKGDEPTQAPGPRHGAGGSNGAGP